MLSLPPSALGHDVSLTNLLHPVRLPGCHLHGAHSRPPAGPLTRASSASPATAPRSSPDPLLQHHSTSAAHVRHCKLDFMRAGRRGWGASRLARRAPWRRAAGCRWGHVRPLRPALLQRAPCASGGAAPQSCLLLVLAASAMPSEAGLADCLAECGAGQVAAPGSDAWNKAVNLQNSWFSEAPAAVVLPSSAQEVAQAIKCARERGLGVTARCGSHGNAGAGAPEPCGCRRPPPPHAAGRAAATRPSPAEIA